MTTSTKDFPAVQALSGTDTDATIALKGLLDISPELLIDGDFRICEASDLDLSLSAVSHLRLAPGAQLRVLGTGQILRSGKWKYQEPVNGPLPEKPGRYLPVHDASVYSVGEWVMIASGTRFPTDDVNFVAVLRQVVDVRPQDQTIRLDASLPSHLPMTLGRRVRAYVKSTVVGQTVIPVVDSPTLESDIVVGSTYDIVAAYARNVASGNVVVTAVTTTPGNMSITLSAPVDAEPQQYFISYTGVYDYMPGPWIVKLQLALPLSIEMGEGSSITGQGYVSPSTLSITPGVLIHAQLADRFSLTGPGFVGSHARTAVTLTHCEKPVIDTSIGDVWDTGTDGGSGGSGYGVSVVGATRGLHVGANTRLFRCRHGLTTNVGPNMVLRLAGDLEFKFPGEDTSTGTFNLGAQGGPEYAVVEPADVSYCTNHGLDTHRAGWGYTFRPGVVRDCKGGIQTRSDATVIEDCLIDGVDYASAVVVFPDIVRGPVIRNVHVRGIAENGGSGGIRQYGFSIASPAEIIDCEVSDAAPGELVGGVLVNDGIDGGDVTIVRFRACRIPLGFHFAGGRATVVDHVVDGNTVDTLYVESGDGLTADNKFVWTNEPFGGLENLVSGGTPLVRYFTPEGATRDTLVMGDNTQWIAPLRLPGGLVHSLGIEVVSAGAGSSIKLALVRATPTGNAIGGTHFAEVTIDASTVGVKEQALANPYDAGQGGLYWIALRLDGVSTTVRATVLNQNRNVSSLAKLSGSIGQGFSRTHSAGAWASWTGLTDASTAPRIGVGMRLS